jgi:hypothetical protein
MSQEIYQVPKGRPYTTETTVINRLFKSSTSTTDPTCNGKKFEDIQERLIGKNFELMVFG